MNVASIIQLGKAYGPVFAVIAISIIIIIFFLRVLIDEDRSSKWRARINKILYQISKKREYEKKYISNDINYKINHARKKLNYTNELLPEGVRVDWIAEKSGEVYNVKEGEFVVCLDPSDCQERNIVRLTNAIVRRTTLIGIRCLFEIPLAEAIDINLVRNVLLLINNQHIMDWFFSNEYLPRVSSSQQLHEKNQIIHEIDERGLFTRILLVELSEFSKRVHGLAPRPFMTGEIEGLVDFLHKIATKRAGQDVPLEYITAYIRIAILLVADTSKIIHDGLYPYLECIAINVQKGVNSIYIIIWDKAHLGEYNAEAFHEFQSKTRELDKSISKQYKVKKISEISYSTVDPNGKSRKAKCIKYDVITN